MVQKARRSAASSSDAPPEARVLAPDASTEKGSSGGWAKSESNAGSAIHSEDEDYSGMQTKDTTLVFDMHRADGRRGTLTLAERSLLRGTTPEILLSGFGRRLRTTVGGIGISATTMQNKVEDEYDKSFPVESLDMFFSHSWHARWWLKYLTLLFNFNAFPAILVTCTLGTAIGIYKQRAACQHLQDIPIALVSGTIVFFLVLFGWHHVVGCVGLHKSVFLDKVCIHQTDSELKAKGIRSIGGFIAGSKMMLVAWDSTYFERLWCTFELAAFFRANPDGDIIVLPVQMGGFIALIIAFTWTQEVAMAVARATGSISHFDLLYHFLYFFESLCCIEANLHLLREVAVLKKQLSQFSVREAKCFCCSVGHRLPDTGDVVPCDREVVNASIEHWFSEGKVSDGITNATVGLDAFDQLVRGKLAEDIREKVFKGSRVPYTFILTGSVWAYLFYMDTMTDKHGGFSSKRFILAMNSTLVVYPLNYGILMRAAHKYLEKPLEKSVEAFCCEAAEMAGAQEFSLPNSLYTIGSWITRLVIAFGNTLILFLLLKIVKVLVNNDRPAFATIWIIFECYVLWHLYRGSPSKNYEERAAAEGDPPPETLSQASFYFCGVFGRKQL